jgi:deaminated glutathione amidase
VKTIGTILQLSLQSMPTQVSPMKIAALQMVSTVDIERNCKTARQLIREAALAGARVVSLPEYFCLMGHSERDKVAAAEVPGAGPIQSMLAQAAREHKVWLIGGTVPLRSADPQRVLNANCVYAPDGELVARYDKMHLFCFDNGREHYDEGVTIQPGHAPVAFQADDLRVGLSVCYDLRFPELYRELMFAPGQSPCDLVSVVAAFTHTTGLAHWEILLRTRAIENQCYVVASAQGGLHENGRRTFGRSMVIDPWGEVLAVQSEGEGVVLAEVDTARIASVRMQLPALQHRRVMPRT